MSALLNIKGMRPLIEKLKASPALVKKVGEDLVRKHARSLLSSSGVNGGLIQIVPPASMDQKVSGTAARKQGEAAVARDVWKVYGHSSDTYARIKAQNAAAAAGYWKAVRRKDWTAANTLARRFGVPELRDFTEDDGAEHTRRREGHAGVVAGKDKTFFVRDTRYVKAYLKRKQKNVGMLSAALLLAYDGRWGPLRGVPSWVTRHGGSWAGASLAEKSIARRGLVVRFVLDAQRISPVLIPFFQKAATFRLRVMEREAPYALRGAVRALALK